MQKIEFLYLSRQDVINVGISMSEAIAVAEAVFREHGLQQFENPPKPGVHPQPDAFIHAMPGYLPGMHAAGLKWVSGFSGNYQHGLPNIIGLMILNDTQTGQPLAVMDCSWITQTRTGAVSAVAARYLARQDAQVVGIVGAGVQGRANALALKEVLPQLKLIKVFDINEDGDKKLKNLSSARLIPIHTHLIELGFLEFVQKPVRTMVFRELKKRRDGYSQDVSKWFQRFSKNTAGVIHERKSFHSFRHTVSYILKNAKVETKMIIGILGHADKDISTGRYGDDYEPGVLSEAIETIPRLKGIIPYSQI